MVRRQAEAGHTDDVRPSLGNAPAQVVRTTRGYVSDAMLLLPTKVQVVVVVHDDPRKLLVEVPGGTGVATADHAPRSPRDTIRRADPATTAMPTAVQAEAGGHETPNSAVTVAPEGVGVVGIDHVDAFHRSRTWV